MYKIKHPLPIKEIAVFSPEHGLLVKKFEGEKKISFIFRKDEGVGKLTESDLIINMGYKTQPIHEYRNSYSTGKDYTDFINVYDLLDKRFPFVKVSNGKIRIGNGPNTFGGDDTPLIIIDEKRVNEQALAVLPTADIKDIRVIRRGSEASTYGGLQASNGVILITLKDKSN